MPPATPFYLRFLLYHFITLLSIRNYEIVKKTIDFLKMHTKQLKFLGFESEW